MLLRILQDSLSVYGTDGERPKLTMCFQHLSTEKTTENNLSLVEIFFFIENLQIYYYFCLFF